MKVKVDTHGGFLDLFVDIPVRTPVTIELTDRQYKILQSFAKANGWDVELVREEKNTFNKKSSAKKSKTDSEEGEE